MSEAKAHTPRVTMVPATRNRFTALPIAGTKKRRVAAYARVSTDSDEQYTSYVAQVSYYTEYIQSHDGWEYVDMYADEGITGTNTKKRDGFNQMVRDALDGKIDLIVTKSVSRFARNTVDSLVTVRQLKEKGVEVFFEKENIYTLDSKGELLITIMSSLAQEESRSISENVTWGQRKRFADGKVSMPYKHFLGYRKGENGEPEIVPEEAETVRRIYRLFLEGQTPYGIKMQLEGEGIPSPAGRKTWQVATILSILSNEKYKGDALLQKTFCTDFLTKKMKVNEGEIPQYYVENSHPAIVTAELFDMVQGELTRRKLAGRQHNGTSCFSGRIFCGCCGGMYGSKVWHSTDKYRRVIWQCNAKFKDGHKCDTPHLTEEAIQQKFLEAFGQLITDRTFIVQDTEAIMALLTDTKVLETEAAKLREDMEVTAEIMRKTIDENACMAFSQDDYNERFASLNDRYQTAYSRAADIEEECTKRKTQRRKLSDFVKALKNDAIMGMEFSPNLWSVLVESATVGKNGEMKFVFKNGVEMLA